MASTTDSPETTADTPLGPSSPVSDKVRSDRELLQQAQAEGKTWSAYVKLSGPGWLQSAITLGGGSLAGSLFLGVLGGVSMLWLQLAAIVLGVIMLSAISYVTLSTGRRPFEAINTEINPALGWGWLIATAMANMIWCMPQFSLCYDALDENLFTLGGGSGLGEGARMKWTVSVLLLVAAGLVVLLKVREGKAAKAFDLFLKTLIGMVVICFFAVTILLVAKGQVDLVAVLGGLIPDFSQWAQPAGQLEQNFEGLSSVATDFWTGRLVTAQRMVMIAAAATAVGINMTFLMPYSMLARGWDKPFRGLARFDLATGMAIPFVIVTSCVVVAAASSFHNRIDDQLASSELEVMQQSPAFAGVEGNLIARIDAELGPEAAAETSREAKLQMAAGLPVAEKRLAAALVQRNAFELSKTLAPLLGDNLAALIFGLGVFGMGFSTIIILMLINGYAFREMFGKPDAAGPFVAGVLVAGLFGLSWVAVWAGEARFWLAIFASTFGMMLLPIAYVTFFLMMNSRRILGDEMPTGGRRWGWNIAMGIAVVGAFAAAATAIYDKAMDKEQPMAFYAVTTLLIVYLAIVVVGFATNRSHQKGAAAA